MRKNIYLFLLLFIITNSCALQRNKIGVVEKFDLIATEKYSEKYIDDWFITIFRYHDGHQYEYAPAKDFYMIMKNFYPNGFIKERGKMLGGVKFGIWEYFDENGKLIVTVDEDQKFGKIKPSDVVKILNNNGIINTEEGTSAVTRNKKFDTSGVFYASIINKFVITFEAAQKDVTEGIEKMPAWKIIFTNSAEYCVCDIDGNTGEFKKNCTGVLYRE